MAENKMLFSFQNCLEMSRNRIQGWLCKVNDTKRLQAVSLPCSESYNLITNNRYIFQLFILKKLDCSKCNRLFLFVPSLFFLKFQVLSGFVLFRNGNSGNFEKPLNNQTTSERQRHLHGVTSFAWGFRITYFILGLKKD